MSSLRCTYSGGGDYHYFKGGEALNVHSLYVHDYNEAIKPWSQIPLRTAANAVRTDFLTISYGLLKAAVRESSVRRPFVSSQPGRWSCPRFLRTPYMKTPHRRAAVRMPYEHRKNYARLFMVMRQFQNPQIPTVIVSMPQVVLGGPLRRS